MPRSHLVIDGCGRGRTPTVYRWVEKNFFILHPELSGKVAFIESPFKGRRFSFPLALTPDEDDLTAIARLLQCWVWMERFNQKRLLPTLAKGLLPVSLRYGVASVTYARGCKDCNHLLGSIMETHKALVNLRIVSQKIPGTEEPAPTPQYLVLEEEADAVDESSVSNVIALRDVHPDAIRAFIPWEHNFIGQYCHPDFGQNYPWWIRGSSVEEMGAHAVSMIAGKAHEQFAIAA